MYSAVDFGCPFTSIKPSLGTSTPTEIMFEASTTSVGAGLKGSPPTASSGTASWFRNSGSSARGDAAAELDCLRFQIPARAAHPACQEGDMTRDVVLHQHMRAAEFAEAVEIEDGRPERVERFG